MRLSSVLLVLAGSIAAHGAAAEPARMVLEPATTRILFQLGATLHSVEGSALLLRGEIRFDTDGGPASGRIVVDARSAETGSDSRDEGMHANVLETARYPEIAFVVEGLEVLSRNADRAEVRLSGQIEIHGASHPLDLPATLTAHGDRIHIEGRFELPYVKWGMKDPSVFVLRVAKAVRVEFYAEGLLRASEVP